MNKLEKVTLRRARKTGRLLVLVINNVHYFRNNDDGKNMLLQLQQRTVSCAASGTSHFQSIVSPRVVHALLMIDLAAHSNRYHDARVHFVSVLARRARYARSSSMILTQPVYRDDFWPFFTLRT